ncbi:hypothetical protein EPJ79_00725 [Brachyspira aalborgi]|uniref:Uncharacterized protein n=1 Tax=Brachyspira aalborgi TaxID=29522 RepID=A0A5C8D2X6_9SPIR|nr:hypothetical protein [Brachyspira aalborgi]TXJ19714.1 hypothetical protein EPJ79_00725 [Brachyspira aalborgi]
MDKDKFDSILESIFQKYQKYFWNRDNYTKNYDPLKNSIGNYLRVFQKALLKKCLYKEVINLREFSSFPKDFTPNTETVKNELKNFYMEVFKEEGIEEEEFNNFYETKIK